VLMVVGILAGWVSAQRYTKIDVSIIIAWFIIPVGWAILSDAILFDNFRQFLFTIPPLFVLIGIGLEHLRQKLIKSKIVFYVLGILILLPGILSIFQLHPYEYIYYNAFVGGVRGAFRNYELDYWCTSYRDATNYINENLPSGSELAVWGPVLTVENYLRDDIQTMKISESTYPQSFADKYTLVCVRQNIDLQVSTNRPLLYEAEIQGLPLSRVYGVVKK
jgi:hypothetical protein